MSSSMLSADDKLVLKLLAKAHAGFTVFTQVTQHKSLHSR